MKIKLLLKDEKGTILPLVAGILILVILIGSVNFALVVMYRDRAIVRNALDAGVASSLAAVAVEKHKAIVYGERLGTDTEVFVQCFEWEEVGVDRDGEPIYEEFDNSFYAPRIQTWRNTQSNTKNYIQLNVEEANLVAKEYFTENMLGNSLEFDIKSWNYSVTYDEQRKYMVKKNRAIVPVRASFVPGREPSGANCDAGVPDVYNEVTNPELWWTSDFADANTGSWSLPSGWTNAMYEEREVIFPRWVEVKASVTVELSVPLGSLVGRETYAATFDITVFKELVYATP